MFNKVHDLIERAILSNEITSVIFMFRACR